jgi:hypothetical protein
VRAQRIEPQKRFDEPARISITAPAMQAWGQFLRMQEGRAGSDVFARLVDYIGEFSLSRE